MDYRTRHRAVQRKHCREIAIKFKKRGCIDCGEVNLEKLTFDHVRGKKKGNICKFVQRRSVVKLREELSKCEVRCLKCHQKRHYIETTAKNRKRNLKKREKDKLRRLKKKISQEMWGFA